MARILIIEDEENLRFSIRQAITKAGHEAAEASTVAFAWDLTRSNDFDVVLTDVNLQGEDGIELVRRLRAEGFDGAVVVMTAYGSVGNAVAAMKQGADDYLQKPLSLEELVLLIDKLLENRRLRNQLKVYQRLDTARVQSRGVIGESQQWRQALALAERLAAVPVAMRPAGSNGSAGGALPTILLLGETGTGKGLLARYVHECARAGSQTPFVHINCSALPPTLVESELFGHEKGAFTDAKAQRPGLFEMAEGGTIFLDEIGDMPLDLQTKVLTVVEEGVFRRVGGTRDRMVRARVIAATNQDLEARVREGRFRRDLLYRLNGFTIRIPPLRERDGDAVLIARDVLERFAREYGRQPVALAPDAVEAVLTHDWPGNVRELVNVMQRVAMLCEKREAGAADLALGPRTTPVPVGHNGTVAGALVFDFEHGVHLAAEVERELIVQALRRTHGNVSRAAKLIGMQRSSFRYRIERFSLQDLAQEIARR